MRKPYFGKWEADDSLENLAMFAQLIDELLFRYSTDTYKAPALNIHSMCAELLISISHYEQNVLRGGAIYPIVEEIIARCQKDDVVKHILKTGFDEYINILSHTKVIEKIKTQISHLENLLNEYYLSTLIGHLRENICNLGSKNELTSLTRSYITELIHIGYSADYIYWKNTKFFFNKSGAPVRINNVSQINDFISLFSTEIKKYSVVYKVSNKFKNISDLFVKPNFELLDLLDLSGFSKVTRNISSFCTPDAKYPMMLKLFNIEAFDHIAARERADNYMSTIYGFIKYYVHRTDYLWSDEALVFLEDKSFIASCRKPIPAVLRRPEVKEDKLMKTLSSTFKTVLDKNLSQDSTSKFFRAISRHEMSINAIAPDNQLLNLWSAIEVLFPSYNDAGDKIVQIVDSVVPYVVNGYAAKLGSDLYNSIKHAKCNKALKVIHDISYGNNKIEKTLALIAVESLQDKREAIYSLLDYHILLKNRLYYLNTRFKDSKAILATISAHSKRIGMQLMRIYRARNMIIHSGQSVNELNILVENIHTYVDRVIEVLIDRLMHTKSYTTIEQLSLCVKIEHNSHMKLLNNGPCIKTDCENFINLLFGH